MIIFKSLKSINGWSSNVTAIPPGGCYSIDQEAQLRTTINLINNTNVPVIIALRDGTSYELEAKYNGEGDECIYIQKEYWHSKDTKPAILKRLDPTNDKLTDRQQAIRKSFSASFVHTDIRGFRSRIEHRVPRKDVEQRGGVSYIVDLDILISLASADITPHHPYSSEGVQRNLIENDSEVNAAEKFAYSLYLVDNEGKVNDKFINFNGDVYRVSPYPNETLTTGVYVLNSGVTGGLESKGPLDVVRSEYWDHDPDNPDAKGIILYNSYDEAKALGSVYEQRDRELKDESQRLELRKQELNSAKLEQEKSLQLEKDRLERDKQKREEAYRDLEHHRKMQAMEDKYYYESRSMRRKDSSDTLKNIPLILSSVVSLVLLGKEFLSSD
ncbi:hypothetical protein [Endozoicomonas sp. ONNA1]|uniref:hypothetical protein n=1 Tax=Endozoicomonas sp. ONNA1 TaxID=2828740 RepID=UPI0021493D5F|nr:hypothetical protein [Endozoicomonas sp. ONNA1]